MGKRGRPVKSQIRQNIADILYFMGEGYGYDIYKIYREIFPKCTQKSIYYHLKKGVVLGEFIVKKIEKEKGDFSWGSEVEKIYYAPGPNMKPKMDKKVKEIIEDYVKRRKRA